MSKYRVSRQDDSQNASLATKEKFKDRRRKEVFRPSDDQLDVACKRIIGVMNWHNGLLDVDAMTHGQLAREILQKININAPCLARISRNEVLKVIETAICKLEREGKLDFRPEDGVCMSHFDGSARRFHRDKYAQC